MAAIKYDKSDYEVFNLGESRTVELRELISLLEKELDTHATIDRQPSQPGDVPQTFADITKARALLGYNPQTQIEAGLHRFVEWFRGEFGLKCRRGLMKILDEQETMKQHAVPEPRGRDA